MPPVIDQHLSLLMRIAEAERMTGWIQHHREPFGLINFPGAKLNGPGNRCLAIVAVNIQMQLLPRCCVGHVGTA